MSLTWEALRAQVHYDPTTGIFTWIAPRQGRQRFKPVGCVNNAGYRVVRIDGRDYLCHRLAWFYMTGEWPTDEVDHRNLVRDDNRWENLREATHQQNMVNKGLSSRNTSGFKGVSFDRQTQKWRATIMVNYHSRSLGLYASPELAHRAYVAAANGAHGEYARTA